MNKIGIIQPGRLGDLIILLPAAKYLASLGNEIYWPIFKNYVWMFEEVVNYVKFIPIENDIYTGVNESYKVLQGMDVIDVAATFPGSLCTDEYVKSGDGLIEKFDAFKYKRLNVPILEKWNLRQSIDRNHTKEEELYNKKVENNKYALVNLKHSGGTVNINMDSSGGQVIHTTEDWNIFHWIKLIENANMIVMVESAMSNLVEQLNVPVKKVLITKDDKRLPTLRSNWIIK